MEKKALNPRFISLVEQIKNETKKDSILIKTTKEEQVPLTVSKFGGYPYIARDKEVKKDKEGIPFIFLAQINCKELPENNIYPKTGLIQFWIGRDDLMGLNFDDFTAQNGHEIVYYETIDESIGLEDVKLKYSPKIDGIENYSPIDSSNIYQLSFEKIQQSITPNTYEFDTFFVKKYNELFPENSIDSVYDLDDKYGEYLWDSLYGFKHRIGGYPDFTQADVRSEDNRYADYKILLLQIDSEDDIIWGDLGIANFFITEEQLKNKNFSKVLYTWDCG